MKHSEDIQAWLVTQLAEWLKLPAAGIDVHLPFVDFGLTSLEAVSLVGDLETWLGVRIDQTAAWEYPTIAALANHLAGLTGAPAQHRTASAVPMAIIGMACRLPGAPTLDAYWRLISQGECAVATRGAQVGGFLADLAAFDASYFGIAPAEAERMDPQQRLLLEVCVEALADAGLDYAALAGSKTGVFVGISNNEYGRRQLAEMARINAHTGTGNALSIAANRLSYSFDFRGPSMAIDTACSSSLVALHMACRALADGDAEMAVVGGVNVMLDAESAAPFADAGILSPSGKCRPFDADADGYVRGEGAGLIVLKTLARAEADGDRIAAVIRGSAVGQGGRSNGLMAPNAQSQQTVIEAAYGAAGLSPSDASYVEAHGTATALGDAIETQVLGRVVGVGRSEPCALGSVKANIGHLEAAAGVAGVIKVVLALLHEQRPPQLHFLASRQPLAGLRVPTQLEPWPSGRRIAGVSSFGFGGANAHVVIEQGARPRARVRPLAFMFTGLGEHYVNMGRELYETEPVFRQAFERCASAALVYTANKPKNEGLDLRAMLGRSEPQALGLAKTSEAHPAIFAVAYALAELWRSWGVQPTAVLGHSLGEYAAAVTAGVMRVEDAARIVTARAHLLDSLAPGGMLAVPLSEQELVPLLQDRLTLAAVNAPAMCVVSGDEPALATLEQTLAARSVQTRRVQAAQAMHGRGVEALAPALRSLFDGVVLSPPKIPMVSSVTGTWLTNAQATDPMYWVNQLSQPVRFADALSTVLQDAPVLLELGPGQALSAFALQMPELRRAVVKHVYASLPSRYEGRCADAFIGETAARLWTAGVALRSPGAFPFKRQRFWYDAQEATAVSTPAWQRERPAPSSAKAATSRHVWEVKGSDPAALCLDACERVAQLARTHFAEALDIVFVAPGACVVESGDAVNPGVAALIGISRVVGQEYPHWRCRVIDAPPGCAHLAAEVEHPKPEAVVAYRGDVRWVLRHAPYRPTDASASGAPRVLLLGGTGDVGRSIAGALSGCAVLTVGRKSGDLRADMADEAALRAAFAQARERLGGLDLVVHAAGVRALEVATPLPDVTAEHVAHVLTEKLTGLDVLARVLAGERCVVVSSASAVVGGVGLGVYAAMHNAVDAVSGQRGWQTIDWDGRVPNAHALWRQLLLGESPQHVTVNAGTAAQLPSHARPQQTTHYAAPEGVAEQRVARVWQEVLRVDKLGRHDNFFHLGGNSLIATQIAARLRQVYHVDLPLRAMFDQPTIAGVAGVIERLLTEKLAQMTDAEAEEVGR